MGELLVEQLVDGRIEMNFPNTKPELVTQIPQELIDGLSIAPNDVYCNQQAYFVIYPPEACVLAV